MPLDFHDVCPFGREGELLDESSFARIGSLCMGAIGLGIIWGWYVYAINAGDLTMGLLVADPPAFRTASVGSAVVAMLGIPWILRQSHYPLTLGIGGVSCALLGTTLLWTGHSTGLETPLWISCCGAACGAAYAMLLLIWMALFLRSSFSILFFCISGASAVMAVYYFLVTALPLQLAPWTALLLLAISPLLIASSAKSIAHHESSCPADVTRASFTARSLLFPTALVLGGGVVRSLLVASWVPPTPLDWVWALVPFGILGSIAALCSRNPLMPTLVLSALEGVICIAIVAALLLPPTATMLSSIIFAGSWLLFTFCIAGALWFSRTIPQRRLAAAAAIVSCIFAASTLSRNLVSSFSQHDLTFLVLAAVLLTMSLVLAIIGTPQLATSRLTQGEPSSIGDLELRCSALAEDFHLTQRERDVFLLLARGYSQKSIADKLFVSENTVKSHRRHIYQKIGISSQQELIDMIEAEKESGVLA